MVHMTGGITQVTSQLGHGLTNVLTLLISLMSFKHMQTLSKQLNNTMYSHPHGLTAKMLALPDLLHFAAFQQPDICM